jgi:hypothetical protein
MRSGLWVIAFVLAAHSDIGMTQQEIDVILFVVIAMLIFDVVEYTKNLFR